MPAETPIYAMGLVVVVIAAVIVYKFFVEPHRLYPLQNEEDLGIAKIWLEKLGLFNEGRITTAYNYFAHLFGQVLAGHMSDVDRKSALALRTAVMDNSYTLAQRIGREKVIYIFNANPLDPKYNHREDRGEKTPIRSIGPVLDCGSRGKFDGFTWIFVKLSATAAAYSLSDLPVIQAITDGMKFLRTAASNITESKMWRERAEGLEAVNLDLNARIGKLASELDEVRTGANLKSMLEPGAPKVGFGWPKVKGWFTDWKQYVAIVVGYFFLAPWIIQTFESGASPPVTNYLTAAIVIACYFTPPIVKKVFGRWLK